MDETINQLVKKIMQGSYSSNVVLLHVYVFVFWCCIRLVIGLINWNVTIVEKGDKRLDKTIFEYNDTKREVFWTKETLADVQNRTVSIFHGWFTLFSCSWVIFMLQDPFGHPNTPLQNKIFIVSCSYVVYDTFDMLIANSIDVMITLHHVAMFIFLFCSVVWDVNGSIGAAAFIMAEISNCPSHLRIIFRAYGLKYTKIYELIDILYIILYFFGRLIIGTPICYQIFLAPTTSWMVRLCMLCLLIQSYYYIYKMVGILRGKFLKMQERSKKNISLWWFQVNPKLKELDSIKLKSN